MIGRGRRAWATLAIPATLALLAWRGSRDEGAVAVSTRASAIYLVAAPGPQTPLLSRAGGVMRVPSGRQGFDVRGAPSISVAVINQVLGAYGSPLAGQGQALYDLRVQYGIDPAFCLAFFVHESAAGTRGEAVLTHSLGNLRATAGAPSLDGYCLYPTWLAGAGDWYRLIAGLYVGTGSAPPLRKSSPSTPQPATTTTCTPTSTTWSSWSPPGVRRACSREHHS